MKISGTYNGDIVRDPQARIEYRMNRSNCHWIVVTEYAVRTRAQGKQLPHQMGATLPSLSIHHPLFRNIFRQRKHFVSGQSTKIPLETPYPWTNLRPTQMSNPLAADLNQVL